MFRRIDRWIGRHMSAVKWMVFWLVFAVGGVPFAVLGAARIWSKWWIILALFMIVIGAVMSAQNFGRLCDAKE